MKILIVGSGGLGCELLKILSLDSSNQITIIDFDTIDPTNLNRQFLFTKENIDKPKALVAAEKMRDRVSVDAIFESVLNYRHIDYYKSFDIVYNCLDNDDVRSYVNQRCHLAGVEMVDGGSAGWLGQAFNNKGECFDCLPRRSTQNFPVCSIRQRPDKFEHCIVWAKTVVEESDRQSLLDEIKCTSIETVEEEKNESIKRFKGNENVNNSGSKDTNQIEDGSDSLKIENESSDEIKCDEDDSSSAIQGIDFTNKNAIDEEDRSRIERGERCLKMFEDRDAESLDRLIYEMALLRAGRFKLNTMSFIDSQTFLKRIIPSICTTNSIIASLMVVSSVCKKNFYLTQSHSMVLEVDINEKKSDCSTCNIPIYCCKFNKNNTTSDILEFFSAKTVVCDNKIYKSDDHLSLFELDGLFCFTTKNSFPYKIYLKLVENIGEISFTRIK